MWGVRINVTVTIFLSLTLGGKKETKDDGLMIQELWRNCDLSCSVTAE